MMTDPSDETKRAPVGLVLEITTPTETGVVKQTVPLDATVGETTLRVMAGLGVDEPDAYEMWVAVEGTDTVAQPYEDRAGDIEWSRLGPDETLLDALRGAQRRPKIAPRPEASGDTPEGNSA